MKCYICNLVKKLIPVGKYWVCDECLTDVMEVKDNA